MSLISDELAEGVKAGRPDAVGEVYVVLADRLLGYLMARVRDRSTAEDLLEATFLELLQKGTTIRGGGAAVKVWLFRAAHFNALDHLRKVRRRGDELRDDMEQLEIVDAERTPEEAALSSETTRRVRAAMAHLSEEQRQVLLLRYVAGLTAPEVATVLEKNPGAIRSLQHRGERALARILSPEMHADEADAGTVGAGAPSDRSRASQG